MFGKTDLDLYCAFHKDEGDLLKKCAGISSAQFDRLTKNFQFFRDTETTQSPFVEIFDG